MIEPLRSRTTTLTEETVQEFQRAIQSGVYLPGGQLPSGVELTRLLGISRVTVGEAGVEWKKGGLS